jgi:hypothetical protein
LKAPSKKEIKKETEKMKKVRDCYSYLLANANEDSLRKKIEELSREHILSINNELIYSVKLPLQNRVRELEDALKKAKEKEKNS